MYNPAFNARLDSDLMEEEVSRLAYTSTQKSQKDKDKKRESKELEQQHDQIERSSLSPREQIETNKQSTSYKTKSKRTIFTISRL